MLALFVPLLISPLPGGAADDLQTLLMDRIEARITLPPGAHPFDAYGRYYSFAGVARVRGIYILPPAKPYFTEGCTISSAQGARMCTQADIDDANARNQRDFARYLRPGQRKWFDESNGPPIIADGGCMVVTFTYEIRTDLISDVQCNGVG